MYDASERRNPIAVQFRQMDLVLFLSAVEIVGTRRPSVTCTRVSVIRPPSGLILGYFTGTAGILQPGSISVDDAALGLSWMKSSDGNKPASTSPDAASACTFVSRCFRKHCVYLVIIHKLLQ